LQEAPPEEVCRRPQSQSVAELVGIENMLAATVENNRLVTALEEIHLPQRATGVNDLPPRVSLTLPASSLELFPAGNPEDYLWQGNLRIAEIHQLNGTGMLALTLVHAGGDTLKTYLSPREGQALIPFSTSA